MADFNERDKDDDQYTETELTSPPFHTSDQGFAELLERTLDAMDRRSASPADLQIHRALVDVAKQYPGHEFTLNPILISLVDVVNRDFRGLTDNRRRVLSAAVARTLFDDSRAHVRLESLWSALQAEAHHVS